MKLSQRLGADTVPIESVTKKQLTERFVITKKIIPIKKIIFLQHTFTIDESKLCISVANQMIALTY